MTNKAIITRRDGAAFTDKAAAAGMLENSKLKTQGSHGNGLLVEADDKELAALERAGYRVKLLPEPYVLHIGAYTFDVRKGEPKVPKELEVPEALATTWPQHLVQLAGPPNEEWKQAIEAQGVRVVEKVSRYALYVEGTPADVKSLEKLPFVVWTGALKPAYKLAAGFAEGAAATDQFTVMSVASASEVLRFAKGSGIEPLTEEDDKQGTTTFTVRSTVEEARALALEPTVRWVEPLTARVLFDERSTQILAEQLDATPAPNTLPVTGYQPTLAGLGIDGAGVTIGIVDSGVDSHDNATMHPDLSGRMDFFVDTTGGSITTDRDGHGTHVAGIAVGNAATGEVDPQGFLLGQGAAPGAHFGSVNNISGAGTFNDRQMVEACADNGAQVMNNSWGYTSGSGYTANARNYDLLVRDARSAAASDQPMAIVSAAGNSGPNISTIGNPWEAKNPIVVGNSLNARPGEGDPGDDIRGLRTSTSRGPAADGRTFPTVVATGTDVISARSNTDLDTATPGAQRPRTQYVDTGGTAHADYARLSGTSMAAPHVSGLCALLIEWWRNRTGGKTPSPAMLKSLLVNGAIDCAGGTDGNGGTLTNIPNNNQGWGRVSLENMVVQAPASDRGPKLFSDQRHAFTADGQEHVMRIAPDNVARPLRITLAWTDAAAAAGANPALVNDLDLEVTEEATGNVFKGNVFNNGFSVTGGAFDALNNVECVYVQNPSGVYTVRIIAASVPASAHPEIATPWQDFALVVDNAVYADASPVAVVPVIDRSGSMVGSGYVDVTRTASKQFIGLMGVNDEFGVVSFGSTAKVEHPGGAAPALVTITGDLDKSAGQTAVDNIAFGGTTAMGAGLEKGRDLLLPSALDKAMVLLSDGYDNHSPSALSVAAALSSDMVVHTCAMGPASDQNLLNDIADATGGKYYFMPTIDDLFEIYNYIRGQVSGDSIVTNESAMASHSRVACTVEGCARRATFTVAWADPTLKYAADSASKSSHIAIRLRDPKGKLLHPHTSFVKRTVGEGFVVFNIEEPLAGRWYVEVSTAIARHTRYTVGGFVDSPLRMRLALASGSAYVGKPIGLYAKVLHGGDAVTGFRASAIVTRQAKSMADIAKKHAKQVNLKSKLAKGFMDDGMPEQLAGLAALAAESDSPVFELGRETVALRSAGIAAGLQQLAIQGRDPFGLLRDHNGLLKASLAAPRWAGSSNIAVTAFGWSPKCGTKFVRKDMVSVLARG